MVNEDIIQKPKLISLSKNMIKDLFLIVLSISVATLVNSENPYLTIDFLVRVIIITFGVWFTLFMIEVIVLLVIGLYKRLSHNAKLICQNIKRFFKK